MKEINVFITCSTKSDLLNEQKEAIVELCKKMNKEYAQKGQIVHITPVAYEDLERRWDVSQQHIKYQVDIVVFLVGDKLTDDDILLKEVEIAVEQNRKRNRPELLVYLSNELDNDSKEIMLKKLNDDGWLYEPLNNTEDLLNNFKKRIEGYVNSYDSIRRKQRKEKRRRVWLRVLAAVLPIIAITSLWFGFHWRRESETRRLLIVGGGSARHYIEDRLMGQPNGLSTKFWLYAPMPSGDSYKIMAEEVMKCDTNYKLRPYYPIVISASQVTPKGDSVFRRTIKPERYRKTGVVIGMYLGEDRLAVYGGNGAIPDSMKTSGSSIDVPSLISIMDDPSIKVYTTNKNSGTFNQFKNYIPKLNEENIKWPVFYDIDNLSKQTKTRWIALGSECYKPLDADESLVLKDGDGAVGKPVYIYFMHYRDMKSATGFALPTATKEFLKSIHKERMIEQINNSITIRNDSVFINNIPVKDSARILFQFEKFHDSIISY